MSGYKDSRQISVWASTSTAKTAVRLGAAAYEVVTYMIVALQQKLYHHGSYLGKVSLQSNHQHTAIRLLNEFDV